MKKFRCFSLILCLSLVLQCALPVSATETSRPEASAETTGAAETVPEATEAVFGTVCIQQGCRTIEGMVPLGGSERKLDTAQAAFLYELNTDTVVYSYNPDIKLAPGSLTKIVTGIVALQYCKLDDMVTVASGIKSRLPVSNLTMNLTSEEEISVRDLMHGLLLIGANDAAVALAEHISGNRQAFVPLMNQWVKQIGCSNTEFATVHGVDGGLSQTTARDMAKIVRAAIKNEDFREIFGVAEYEVPATNKSEARAKFRTTNHMRYNGTIEQFYDNRVQGGMQSAEDSSGACLAVTAENNKGMYYIGVVMGCVRTYASNGWSVETYGNFEDMTELLKFGFNNYKVNRIVYDGMSLGPFSVSGGESNAVGQATVNIDSVVPVSAQMRNLTMSYDTDGVLSAPIQEGQRIATLAIKYRESCLAEVEVFAMGDVKASGDTGVTIRSAAGRGGADASGILSAIGTVCVIVLGLVAAYLAVNSYMRSRIRAQRRRRRANRRRTR